MTTPDTKAIREAITEHWGPRCRTKDTDDFPELLGQEVGRCPVCRAWEQFDALCDAIDELRAEVGAVTEKRDEWADRAMTDLGNVLDLRADNERLRSALYDVIGCDHHNFCDGGTPKYVRIARAALAQKGNQP